MSSKNRLPKTECKLNINVGNLVELKKDSDLIQYMLVIKKIKRFGASTSNSKFRMNDLLEGIIFYKNSICPISNKLDLDDAGYVSKIINNSVFPKTNYYSLHKLTTNKPTFKQIGKNKRLFNSVSEAVEYYAFEIVEENPRSKPLTWVNYDKIIKMLKSIPYVTERIKHPKFDITIGVVVRGKQFKQYVRRNMFKLFMSQKECHQLTTRMNNIGVDNKMDVIVDSKHV